MIVQRSVKFTHEKFGVSCIKEVNDMPLELAIGETLAALPDAITQSYLVLLNYLPAILEHMNPEFPVLTGHDCLAIPPRCAASLPFGTEKYKVSYYRSQVS